MMGCALARAKCSSVFDTMGELKRYFVVGFPVLVRCSVMILLVLRGCGCWCKLLFGF